LYPLGDAVLIKSEQFNTNLTSLTSNPSGDN
jgi:hypothetical protein